MGYEGADCSPAPPFGQPVAEGVTTWGVGDPGDHELRPSASDLAPSTLSPTPFGWPGQKGGVGVGAEAGRQLQAPRRQWGDGVVGKGRNRRRRSSALGRTYEEPEGDPDPTPTRSRRSMSGKSE